MSNVVDFQYRLEEKMAKEPHFVLAIICLGCTNRWIGLVHKDANGFELECPACREQNSFYSVLPSNYLVTTYGPPNQPA